MHAPYAAQYCVMGGSGAGNGGSFTFAAICAASAAAVSEAPLAALVDEAGVAAVAAVVMLPAVDGLAAIGVEAPFACAVVVVAADVVVVPAVVAAGALAPDAEAAAGMLAPNGADEKLLDGNGGRDGAPVEEVLVAAGLRGGICDSRVILTLVCLFAAA